MAIVCIGAGSDIKKTTAGLVVKTADHRNGNFLGKVEITQVGGGLIGIQTGDYGEGVIIEHAGNLPPGCLRIGIGNHVLQA